MVEVFKTTVTDKQESKRLIEVLKTSFANAKINFDLNDCDNILRIEADKIDTNLASGILRRQGYNSELLL